MKRGVKIWRFGLPAFFRDENSKKVQLLSKNIYSLSCFRKNSMLDLANPNKASKGTTMKYFKDKAPKTGISLFGPHSFFQGKVILKEETRIAGRIEGTIITEETLTIEETALIQGQIEGVRVEISGEFKGKITVLDTLHLTATARVEGEICATKLIVEEGAQLRGQILNLADNKDRIAPADSAFFAKD